MAPIRVALVEDDPQLLKAMEALLAATPLLEVVGSYPTGHEAVTGILACRPEVALIDLELPDISGVEVIQQVRASGGATECLVRTVYEDDVHLFAALRAGAVGYIVKSENSLAEVVQAIQGVRRGEAPMSMGLARRILYAFRTPSEAPMPPQTLTKREREILEWGAQGFTSKKVADVLRISYEAVRSHHKNIYRKLQVHSLVEAVAVFRGERHG